MWSYKGEEFTTEMIGDNIGFVYIVTDKVTGMKYVGKKGFFSKVTKPPLKGKKRVRLDTKPSDWKVYTSSGKFKELIDSTGKEGYTFEMVELCKTANDMNVVEIEYIVAHGRKILCVNEFLCRGASYKSLKE